MTPLCPGRRRTPILPPSCCEEGSLKGQRHKCHSVYLPSAHPYEQTAIFFHKKVYSCIDIFDVVNVYMDTGNPILNK